MMMRRRRRGFHVCTAYMHVPQNTQREVSASTRLNSCMAPGTVEELRFQPPAREKPGTWSFHGTSKLSDKFVCASAPSRALCAQQYDSTDVILPGIGSFCSFSAPSNCALDYRANSLADGWCHKYSNSFWWQLACTTMLGYGVQAEEALT